MRLQMAKLLTLLSDELQKDQWKRGDSRAVEQ